jgi:hypothetical protein
VEPLVAELLDPDASEQIIAELVGEIASSETSAQMIAELVDEVAAEEPPPIAAGPAGLAVAPSHTDEARAPKEPQSPAVPDTERIPDIAARMQSRLAAEPDTKSAARSPSVEPSEDQAPFSRLARRLDMAGAGSGTPPRELPATRIAAASSAASGGDDISSRRDRFAERLNQSGAGSRSQRSLLDRLEEYGITPTVNSGEPIVPIAEEFRHDEERWIPPRLYELEAVRYLLLIGLVVVAVTSAWIVLRTVSASSELVAGEISSADLDRINVARRAFVTALNVTLTLVVLWCAVFVSHSRRAGVPDTKEWRAYGLLVVVIALDVVSFVLDGDTRGTTSLICVIGGLAAALTSVAIVTPIVRWFERRTIGLTVWSAGFGCVTLLSWIGGVQRPVEPTDALEALTFVAVLQAIATAVVVVVAAVNTSDLEDAIRLSPALAQTPQRAHRNTPVA